MKILILEDSVERHVQFRENLSSHDIIITDSAKDAIRMLVEDVWDVLFLDHDLGHKIYVPSGENTGYEVAEFLGAYPEFKPKNIIIHSWNSVGAKNMLWVLPKAIYLPSAWMKKNLERIGLI